jgi:pimeloyl-ACP methyl ester carboxylesterase
VPTIQIANGLRLFYRESGAGEQVILLVHGNTASSLWWERVMAALPPGIRAVAPDLPHCGDSDRSPQAAWSMADLSDAIYQFAQALGLPRCTVVGHSLGGNLVQQLAVDHPDLVERLVLINSGPPDGLRLPPEHYAKLEQVVKAPSILKQVLAAMMPTAPRDAYYDQLLAESVAKSAAALLPNGYALAGMDLTEQVQRLQIPVLILYGQQDGLVTLAMAERTRDLIPGSTLELWPEIGHSAPVECPERLVERVLGFVNRGV